MRERFYKIVSLQLANLAAESKRDADTVSQILAIQSTYVRDSNRHFYNYIALEPFHKAIVEQLKREPSKVIERLEEVRAEVLKCPLNVHFACDPERFNATNGDQPQQHQQRWAFIGDNRSAATQGEKNSVRTR